MRRCYFLVRLPRVAPIYSSKKQVMPKPFIARKSFIIAFSAPTRLRLRYTILIPLAVLLTLSVTWSSCQKKLSSQSSSTNQHVIQIKNLPDQKRVDVHIDGQLFTAYQYPDNITKPILYPLLTANGKALTRGYPIDPRPGERVDHPHHVGHWLNYGNVNGLDFWNNSEAIPAEKKHRYGTIEHQAITLAKVTKGKAQLVVSAVWKAPAGEMLLDEATQFIFSVKDDIRIIERITTLTAKEVDVSFKDNKEGMFGIRVTRALEFPTDRPQLLIGADGKPNTEKTVNNEGVSGNYLSSEGLEGSGVWGTRAKWMKLYGKVAGEDASIAIVDHPSNPGYPTYWHARDYGLFAANPLGQSVFSKGKEQLNFSLKAGEKVTFRYQILVHSGSELSSTAIEETAEDFARSN